MQKTFSNNRGAEFTPAASSEDQASWVGFELTRSLVAVPGTDRPPLATDTETITQLLRPSSMTSPSVVTGRVRVAEYLTPNDALYFETGRKAVSISDYNIRMRKSS